MPHWRQDGATYFVTWRLKSQTPTLSALERDVVRETIWHFEQVRFDIYASVVMNDHVHVLMTPYAGHPLAKIVQAWKSFSARRVQEVGDRRGRVWQREYFDRIIRHDLEFKLTLEYIMNNPVKRWPGLDRYPWLDLTGQEAGVTSG
jgi:REP element-mobilizing transposase RayT